MLKELLKDSIGRRVAGQSRVALSFSSGTDSLCILFACLEMNIRPVLYTYYVQGVPSKDLTISQAVAKHYSLKHITVMIPNDIAHIQTDVLRLVRDFKVSGKVCIQCCHGHMRLGPFVKEKVILNGSGIDGLWGAYKTFAFDGSRKDKAIFDERRRKHLAKPNDDAMLDQQRIYNKWGTKVLYPYRGAHFVNRVMKMSWEDINRPRMKWALVKDFPQYNEMRRIYRPRGSQQLVAGTRELHNKLLHSNWNFNDRKRVDEIYKDIAKRFKW